MIFFLFAFASACVERDFTSPGFNLFGPTSPKQLSVDISAVPTNAVIEMETFAPQHENDVNMRIDIYGPDDLVADVEWSDDGIVLNVQSNAAGSFLLT